MADESAKYKRDLNQAQQKAKKDRVELAELPLTLRSPEKGAPMGLKGREAGTLTGGGGAGPEPIPKGQATPQAPLEKEKPARETKEESGTEARPKANKQKPLESPEKPIQQPDAKLPETTLARKTPPAGDQMPTKPDNNKISKPQEQQKAKSELNQQKQKSKQEKGETKDKSKLLGALTQGGTRLGVIDYILLFLLLVLAGLIDILPFVSIDISSLFDWIFDIIFFIAVFLVLFIITGDIIGSLVGRKAITNIIQTIAEFIPVIDVLPFHLAAVIIIYIDLRTGLVSAVTQFKQPTKK